jgi:hypothetical protein
LPSQTVYASKLKTFQMLLNRKEVRPGWVFSLQSFGAYGANYNPHCHRLVTDGAFVDIIAASGSKGTKERG